MQVCVYTPVNNETEKGKTEIKRFWKDLGQCLKRLKNQRRVFVLKDITDKFGIMEIWGVVEKWSTVGVKGTGQYLIVVCRKGFFLANTFQHKPSYRSTLEGRNERSLIDYIAVDNKLKEYVLDAKII